MVHKNKKKKIWAMLLALGLTVSMLSGCGGGGSSADGSGTGSVTESTEGGGQAGEASGNESPEPVASPEDQGENTAMGRYVETVTDLSEFCNMIAGVTRFSDGSLQVTDLSGTKMTLADGASEWEPDKISWFKELNSRYVISISYGEDGTAGIIYKPEKAESDSADSFYADATSLVVKPDGTQIPVDSAGLGAEWEPSDIWITDTGRAFIGMISGVIYEVGEDGGVSEFLTVDRRPEQVQFQGNLMIMDAERYDGLLLYDMEKKEYVEDEVLHDFVQENYKDRSYSSADCFEVMFFPGEEGELYIAGEKGLHRHVIGGSVMEQVIDGALSCFGNPSYTHSMVEMTALPDNEFLAVFYGGKAVRFAYNPDIPTVPNEKLKVYSLKENDTIRQGVSIYQNSNPEVYVEYETGMGDGRHPH